MEHATKLFTKSFMSATTKEAYLKACKWVATHIMANDEISKDIVWKITKVEDLPSVELEVFSTLNDAEHARMFCAACKQFHASFYINQQQNCNCCNMQAYRSQAKDRGRQKKSYKLKLLNEKVLLK